jgi:hypothetical protein
VSYEVLPPLNISGIAWELRCLNESSVARHQPELWARGIHMEGYFVHLFLCWTSWCYNYRTSITTISIWPFQASGPSRVHGTCLLVWLHPAPSKSDGYGPVSHSFPFLKFCTSCYSNQFTPFQATSSHFKRLQAISSHFNPCELSGCLEMAIKIPVFL